VSLFVNAVVRRVRVMISSRVSRGLLGGVCVVVCLGVFGGSSSASRLRSLVTHISATTYSSNTEWTQAGSPYVLDGNVTVAAGATLTIDAGVIVKFNGTFRSMYVNGTLSAVGTAGLPIVFTSYQDDSVGGDTNGDGNATSGAPGQWNSISFSSSGSVMQYVTVRDGGYGTAPGAYAPILLNGSGYAVTLDHATITSSQSSAVSVSGRSSVTITNSTLSNNDYGLSVDTATATVDHSTIDNNTHRGVWFNLPTVNPQPAASSITSSEISGNGTDGVYIGTGGDYPVASWPTGTGNNIYSNNAGGVQLKVVGGYKNAAVNWRGNYWGDGVYFWYSPGACGGTAPNTAGHLAYRSSGGSPPAGPIDGGSYYVIDGNNLDTCPFDWVAVGPPDFSPTKLDTSPRQALGQSIGDCGVDDSADVEGLNQTSCEADVNAGNGGFTRSVTDLSMPGIGIPFALTRTYNSLDPTPGPLGRGWTYSYNAGLGVLSNGDIVYRSGTGQQLYYKKQGSSFVTPPGGRATLTLSGGVYDLARYDQVHERFTSSGALLSVKDRNNQGLTFSYTSGLLTGMTDSVGRSITLSYTGSNLTQVNLPDGRHVVYAYTNGLLTSVQDARGGTTTYTYEAHGFLQKGVDQNQHTMFELTYGSDGRVLTEKDGLGKTTSFSWDQPGQTETTTDPRGKTWKDIYANGLLVKRIDPLGDTVQYAYGDADLNQTSVTDARGNTTTMTFDGRGNMLTRTAPSPLSYQESWMYNTNNDPTSYTDGRGKVTSYGYDGAGNLTSKTQPGSVVTQYGRDPNGTGLLVSLTDPRGKTTSYGYDANGNLTSTTTPLGEKTTMGYDSSGRLTSKVDPRGNVSGANPADYTTSYTYDNNDDKLTQTDANGHVTHWAYDPVGNLTSTTDPNNNVTSHVYDADNRLTAVTAPGNASTGYVYDDNGNLTSRTDPNNHVTGYGYDDANRRTSTTDPLNRTWTYGYDANGNRASVAAPGGGTTTYGYDVLNRLTSISYSDSTPAVGFAYDGDGNRTQMTDGAGTLTYTYDDLNRLTSQTRGSNTFTYGYDNAGNITSRTYPDSVATTYGYDDDERLASATFNSNTVGYGYDPAGELVQTTRPSGNGWTETRTYDHAGQLTEIKDANGGSTLQQLDYAYDPNGNATSLTRIGGAEYYQYDTRNRLTKVCYTLSCASATDTIAWTYDGASNRLTEVRPAGTTTYTYDAADELTQTSGLGGTVTYGYDQRGNQTSAGATTYTYNLARQLTSATVGGVTTSYGYDGDGNRLTATTGATTTGYLWDTNNPLPQLALERSGSTSLRDYLYGLDSIALLEGGNTFHYHHDRLGSITALTSSSGATEWTYTYEPFGNPKTTTKVDPNAPINPLGYVGQYQDPASGLYDLRARQYNPTTGLFTSTDPSPAGPASPYEAPYDYAGQDPINGYDLDGTTRQPPRRVVGLHDLKASAGEGVSDPLCRHDRNGGASCLRRPRSRPT
jgi:RHS repeat-associated protein